MTRIMEMENENRSEIQLTIVPPYDFQRSLERIRSFDQTGGSPDDSFRMAARIKEVPAVIEINTDADGNVIASSFPDADKETVRSIAEWVLFADLDLAPFYKLDGEVPAMADVISRLYGVKPMRPVTIFEMAVTAIIEQQISLLAANRIRARFTERFGEKIDDLFLFPEPVVLIQVPDDDLRACGLSRQKGRYIKDLAGKIVSGELDPDTLKDLDDDSVRDVITSWKGFGRWSADYILIRGLARPDCVPVDDLAIRSVVGEFLGDGSRLSAEATAEVLEPFRPYRGLTAFYLLAAHRLISK